MEQANAFIAEYLRFFPSAHPTAFQMDMIVGQVDDLKRWTNALMYWAGNDYRPQSVFKLINYYTELKDKPIEQMSRQNLVGTNSSYEDIPPCGICGKDICLSLHQDERRSA